MASSSLKTDTLSMKDLASQFNIAAAFIANDKSLQAVLKDILKNGITDVSRMQAMIQNTDWYKNHTNAYRQFMYAKDTNPAQYAANLEQQKQTVLQKASDLGVTIDDATAQQWAEQTLMGSSKVDKNGKITIYDSKWLEKQLASAIDFSKTKTINGVKILDVSGDVAATVNEIYATAADYGIDTTMSSDSFNSWMHQTVTGLFDGTMNKADVNNGIKSMAMNNFPGFADQINKGYSLRQAAAPQLSAIATELELDSNTLDLRDNVVQKVLNNQDKTGTYKPMTAYDARKIARQDSRWKFTENAKKEYQDIGSKILHDFGFGA